MTDAAATLALIAEEVAHCTACPLCRTRTNAVPGEGPADAEILLIGEGPGQREDALGRPFVGPSGDLLEQWLAEIGLAREQVFIANVVKCRPPGNRDPEPSEIAACAQFLDRQIAALAPKLIATLGRHSMNKFFPGGKITKIHGIRGVKRVGQTVFLPLFHPAYVLRNMNAMPDAIADIRLVPRLIARLNQRLHEEASQPSEPEIDESTAPPQQTSMF
ncbi:uracil-DNA glycosylase [Herpetosiphon giganteus]|uniref:uracil-DNA glycosylase n=1 Tax=Herpetosiphon giganteus TaxID=2029754 RepID=UPI00195E6FF4|nr:uracil-DNA glycosylase [Herpetosiphon giganteus]MBM7842127.1 DNA polymerase [Herpetosiphon giganteus]